MFEPRWLTKQFVARAVLAGLAVTGVGLFVALTPWEMSVATAGGLGVWMLIAWVLANA